MEIKVFTSSYEIISNGTIVFPSDEFVEFTIQNLRFRLSFTTDDTEKTHYSTNVKDKESSNSYMEVVFYNIPSLLFATPSNILELGSIDGKRLCLRFSISTIKNDNKTNLVLVYNWLMEK